MDTDTASETISSDRKCMMVTKESVFFAPNEAISAMPQDSPYCHAHQYSTPNGNTVHAHQYSTPGGNTMVRKKLVHVETSTSSHLKVPSSVLKMIVILVLVTITVILMARNNGTFQLNFIFLCLGLAIGLLSGSLVSGGSDEKGKQD